MDSGQVATRISSTGARQPAIEVPLTARAVAPALSELRHLVSVLMQAAATRRRVACEVGGPLRSATEAHPGWQGSLLGMEGCSAMEALVELVGDLDLITQRMAPTLLSLEWLLLVSSSGGEVDTLLQMASRLAHHHTKLVGGVRWVAGPTRFRIGSSPRFCVSLLTAALSMLSKAAAPGRSGIRGCVVERPGHMVIELARAGLSGGGVEHCVHELRRLAGTEAEHRVFSEAKTVLLAFPATPIVEPSRRKSPVAAGARRTGSEL